MDINDLVYSDSADMILTGHNGKPMKDKSGSNMMISFFGEDTDERLRAYSNYRTKMIAAGKDDEMLLQAECEMLADLTSRLHNIIFNGKEVTIKDAAGMYRKVSKVRNDALIFVGTTVNFIKGRSKK